MKNMQLCLSYRRVMFNTKTILKLEINAEIIVIPEIASNFTIITNS